MICHTENCERAARPGHAYCDDCFAVVLHTGRPPVLPRQPEWLRRAMAKPHGLSKALDRSEAA